MNTYVLVMSAVLLVLLGMMYRSWRGLPRWYRNDVIKTDLTVIAIAVALALGLAYCAGAQAQTGHADLDALLKGKMVIAQGFCSMETKEKLGKPGEAPKDVAECVIGQDPADPRYRYVGLQDEKGYYLVIRTDVKKKTQKVIWRRPGLKV